MSALYTCVLHTYMCMCVCWVWRIGLKDYINEKIIEVSGIRTNRSCTRKSKGWKSFCCVVVAFIPTSMIDLTVSGYGSSVLVFLGCRFVLYAPLKLQGTC